MSYPYERVVFAKKICLAGVDIATDDVLTVYLNDEQLALHSFPTATLIVVDVLEGGRGFTYDRRVAGQDIEPYDILGLIPDHDCVCPAQCNFSIAAAATFATDIASVEVDAVAIVLPNYPYVAGTDDAQLEADLRDWLNVNHPQTQPLPQVTVDSEAGNWIITITASVLDFTTVNGAGVPQVFVNSCDPM